MLNDVALGCADGANRDCYLTSPRCRFVRCWLTAPAGFGRKDRERNTETGDCSEYHGRIKVGAGFLPLYLKFYVKSGMRQSHTSLAEFPEVSFSVYSSLLRS